ncbi:hypothetical protein PENTCL1PPCAC_14237, partial [Pristionchus entomophagus]
AVCGRRCVTFLFVINAALFLFHIFVSLTTGFGFDIGSQSNYAYAKLLAEPLITFYRFHCCVCLAEVWKGAFAPPRREDAEHPNEAIPRWMRTSVASTTTDSATFSLAGVNFVCSNASVNV